ncbi:MAG TPA: integrin alpha, partial [Candidatus Polarisedimenticolia bacterium]|nr:integrin alpha [Candidatus Polarisedimenticolia bacterium]
MRPSARLLLACLLAMIPGLMWPGRPTRAQDGPRPGWFGSARHCIDDREFELTRLSGSGAETWQAPNRAHRIRTTFSPERVRVVPRNGQAFVPWTLEWSVAVWERDGVAWPASRATLVPDGRRVEFRRDAAPLEWYENTPRGLEQKFLIRAPRGPERPCRRAPFPERVQIDLRLGGDVSPRLRDGGQEIDFVTASGARALHLGPLRAVDARGRVLAARYESWERSDGRGLRYVVDVSGAVDPIRLEAIVNDSGWAAESEQPGASFGLSVATAGDVNGDGYSDIIVGAPHFDAGQEDEGRVFAYFGSAAGPSASPDWSAEGDQAHALFGSAVAAAGDVNGDGYGDLVVGAPRFDDGDEDVGGAFVYLGSPSGPGDSPVWMVEGTRPFAGFGTSVATAGDVNGDGRDDLLVGAPRHAEGGVEQGAAFLYLGSAAGPADQPAWVATGGQPGGRFGERVAAAGDVNGDRRSDIAVGAPRQDDGDMEEGRVFVYLGSTTGLSAGPDWSAEIDQPGALFGSSLAAGDVNGDGYGDLVVGAPFFEDHEDDEGHAFGYFGSAGGLGAGPEWVGECNQPSAGFGTS